MALTLVPVEVFGGDGRFGLMDAHPDGSDCNRAEGYIYRAEDIHPETDGERRPGWEVVVFVRTEDLPFFQRRFREGNYYQQESKP